MAVTLAPENADIIDVRGQIYAALGRWIEAIADLDKAIAGGASNASTFVARGRAREAIGDPDAAIADYRKALTLAADDEYEKHAQATARERLAALGIQIEPDSKG